MHTGRAVRIGVALLGALVLSLTAFGQTQVWKSTYNGPAGGDDLGYRVALDASGNAYVVGTSDGGAATGNDFITIKYGPAGNRLWVRLYDGPAHGDDQALGVVIDKAGNILVAGQSMGDGTDCDYAIVKYDPAGNVLWVQRYDGPGHSDDRLGNLKVDDDLNVYVTGRCTNEVGSWDYCTIKYDADGNELWARLYDGIEHGQDEGRGLGIDGDGNVYVTGYTNGDAYKCATLKYDVAGNLTWERYYYPGHTVGNDLVLTPDGGIAVAGWTTVSPKNLIEPFVLRYDGDGNQLWDNIGLDFTSSWNMAEAIAQDAAGNLFITGTANMWASRPDIIVMKFDPSGNRQWFIHYDGPGGGVDQPYCISIGPSGNVYTDGYSMRYDNNYDCATLAVDTFGRLLWVASTEGIRSDGNWWPGPGLAVDAAENVFVTDGAFTQPDRLYDAVTIKYAPMTGDIHGACMLGDWVGTVATGTLKLRLPGDTHVAASYPLTVDPSGSYDLPGVVVGAYDVAVEFPGWLRRVLHGVQLTVPATTLNFALTNGDADYDNQVGGPDLSVVLSNFLHRGTPPFDGDLNWDGRVDLFDLSIVLANYDSQGDP